MENLQFTHSADAVEENKKYHFAQGEKRLEMTIEEAMAINESSTNSAKLEFDDNWYLSHGYTLLDDIEKSHQG